jgi:hypothetical protein
LKDKINQLESNSKNKNIRDLYMSINEFQKRYQPRTTLVKNMRCYLLMDPHTVLNRWKNYFCQLLNIPGAGAVRQTEVQTVKPFVPESSVSEVEVAMIRFKQERNHCVLRSINLS